MRMADSLAASTQSLAKKCVLRRKDAGILGLVHTVTCANVYDGRRPSS